jgi:hypothetical protein
MTTSKRKPCARKAARPAADETCTVSRTVPGPAGTVLTVWSCAAPKTKRTPPRFDVIEKIGRYTWRFFFVTMREAFSEDDPVGAGPGWYFTATDPDPNWIYAGSVGPYSSLEAALEDIRSAEQGATSNAVEE